MNSYKTSSGERIPKSVINRKVTEAKQNKIAQMIDTYGYIFCEECGRNANTGIPLDCSHNISVDKCQKTGHTELAWDINNITIRCRICHQRHDHTYLQTLKNKQNETHKPQAYIRKKFRII